MLNAIPASHGTTHKFNKETTAPNRRFPHRWQWSRFEQIGRPTVSVDLAILDASLAVESALAKSQPKGATMSSSARQCDIASRVSHGEKQLFNGLGNDASGFSALAIR